MFDRFLKHIGYTGDEKPKSESDFLKLMNGKSFFDGMYRFFSEDDLGKWTTIVEKTFPKYSGKIHIFAYDWLGRAFAVNHINNTVLLMEPGTGDVLSAPVDLEEFHDTEIVDYSDDCLAAASFRKWMEQNGLESLPKNKCGGYKVPLFLGGADKLENIEVSDIEVYWEIMMALL